MGHATHFLQRLERVEGPALDLALGLYRDTELLRWVLARLALTSAASVALPLEEGPEPAHVLVTGEGHFLTCLAARMRPDAAVVPWSKLQLVVGELEAWRGLRARSQQASRRATERVMTAGQWLCREDFEDLVICAVILPDEFVHQTIQLKKSLESFEASYRSRDYRILTPPVKELLSLYWKHTWAMSHTAVAVAEAALHVERARPGLVEAEAWADIVTNPGLRYLSGSFLRSLWCLGRLGKLVLPVLREWVRLENFEKYFALGGLEAIALRHSGLRAEALKAMFRRVPPELRSRMEEFSKDLHAELIPEAYRLGQAAAAMALPAIGMVQAGDSAEAIALVMAEEEIMSRFLRLADLPEVRWAGQSIVLLRALAGMAATEMKGRIRNAMVIAATEVPIVARIDAADLFLPRTLIQALAEANYKGVPIEEVRQHLDKLFALSGRGKPVVVEAKPGRNEPCRCGSGRKYKACCGR